MNHAQIRAFHAVANEGSFTKAARLLGISQPAVTIQVRALEEYYGVNLLHRSGQRVSLTDLGSGLLDFTRRTGALIVSMLRCRRPIVGALNGTVAGAGAVIASACDLRIASRDAKIAFLFTKVGLSGADMGASWLLPRIVGLGRAMELLMTGDFVGAERAEQIGLYNRVVAKEQVGEEAREWAERLARGPSFGLEVTKKMVLREASMDLESAMAAEVEIQAACMEDPNFRESYDAFVDKRKPKFG